jgi:hypothetical protein
MIPGEESILLFQPMHQIRKLLHHAFVRAKVLLLGQNQAEVEDELIAVVSERFHADRIAQYPVSICAHLDQIAAELLPGDHEEGDVGKGQEERLRGGGRRGYDGSVGDLMDNLGAWNGQPFLDLGL